MPATYARELHSKKYMRQECQELTAYHAKGHIVNLRSGQIFLLPCKDCTASPAVEGIAASMETKMATLERDFLMAPRVACSWNAGNGRIWLPCSWIVVMRVRVGIGDQKEKIGCSSGGCITSACISACHNAVQ